MTTICTICARGNSKGLPGKNSKSLLGKPLISYTIEQALTSGLFTKVFVSTDSNEIAEIAKASGATVPFIRPSELAQDETPKMDAINHLVNFVEKRGEIFDTIVDLDPTSPLRNIDDIKNALDCLKDGVDAVITAYKSNKNPYFNMVEVDLNGHAILSKKSTSEFFSRQSCTPVYAMNASIYVWRKEALTKGLWDNKKIHLYAMPMERSIDIDTPLDWKLVELLMAEKLKINEGLIDARP